MSATSRGARIVKGVSEAFGIWTAGIGWSSMVAWIGYEQRANAVRTRMCARAITQIPALR
ncbi:hypothetical protein F6X42_13270 [Paraburkholderia sp. WC7.3b]|uniref:Uncharacterized protein n=1 Tax=Paraburkholderia podalyriae TaxID=1938811 RepID=A0ABR7PME8_9BURK|nr:hypothetical protein [Paraburkholderia podalyriae]